MLSVLEEAKNILGIYIIHDTGPFPGLVGPPEADQISREVPEQTSQCPDDGRGQAGSVSACMYPLTDALCFLSTGPRWCDGQINDSNTERCPSVRLIHSGDVWRHTGWKPAGRCMRAPRRVPGHLLARHPPPLLCPRQPLTGPKRDHPPLS